MLEPSADSPENDPGGVVVTAGAVDPNMNGDGAAAAGAATEPNINGADAAIGVAAEAAGAPNEKAGTALNPELPRAVELSEFEATAGAARGTAAAPNENGAAVTVPDGASAFEAPKVKAAVANGTDGVELVAADGTDPKAKGADVNFSATGGDVNGGDVNGFES